MTEKTNHFHSLTFTVPGTDARLEGHVVGSPSHKTFLKRQEEERDRREAERAEAFIHGGPLKARKKVEA